MTFFELFSLKEIEKIKKFQEEHDCTIKGLGAIGGQYTYSFTPTNIGTVIKISCACGKEEDITDYEDW